MNSRVIAIVFLTVSLAAISACGIAQKLHIESDPSGAEVYLMRRGEYEISASIDGIGGSCDGDSFEDDYYLIGTTPLDYEFGLSDTESSFYIPGIPAGASVTKNFEEGIIRIVMNGYTTEEKPIQFSNSTLSVVINLSPVAPVETGGEAVRGETGRTDEEESGRTTTRE
jgi:hypothetical protein